MTAYCDRGGLPFGDAGFDLVWTQNVALIMQDRRRYHDELRRVVKPGGCIGIGGVLAGPNGMPYLPSLGVHVILGAPSREVFETGRRGYAEGRMRSMQTRLQCRN